MPAPPGWDEDQINVEDKFKYTVTLITE